MSKYTPASIAKAFMAAAIAAATTASALAGGVDLSSLDPGQWLGVLGAAFTAFGSVFITPNKSTEPSYSPAEQVAKSVQEVIQNQQVATAELEMVKQAVTGAVGVIPGIGPLAAQVINSIPGPQFPQFPNGAWQP